MSHYSRDIGYRTERDFESIHTLLGSRFLDCRLCGVSFKTRKRKRWEVARDVPVIRTMVLVEAIVSQVVDELLQLLSCCQYQNVHLILMAEGMNRRFLGFYISNHMIPASGDKEGISDPKSELTTGMSKGTTQKAARGEVYPHHLPYYLILWQCTMPIGASRAWKYEVCPC
jgi:hypothetical protein